MNKFTNMVKSNVYKYMHSAIGIINIIVPIVSIIIFSLYFPLYNMTANNKMVNFSKIICYGYIFMISLTVTVSYELNQRAGKCQDILSSPNGKLKAHVTNIVAMSGMSYIALGVALMGFYFVNVFNQDSSFSLININTVLLIIFFVNMIMYVLQYVVCYTFGKGASIGMGVLCVLISALVDVTWDNGWKFLPPAYAPKYLDLQLYKILNMPLNEMACENYMKSAPVVLIISVLIIFIFVKWANNWEGTDFEME